MAKLPDIPLEPVASSSLSGFGYHAGTRTLALQFKGGRTYHYIDVPETTVQALRDAKSAGKFVAKNVLGKFKHRQAGK